MGRLASLGMLCMLLPTSVLAQSVVDTVRIDVALLDDGAASVSEVWHIDVSDDITEWYRVVDNLGRMDLRDLRVRDETLRNFVTEAGEWKVKRSRAEKAGRCGLVAKPDGYELCWGVGSSGVHTYTVTYLLTGLVKGYEDRDGFNYMFVARDQGSPPGFIEVRIHRDSLDFTTGNTRVWAFGFEGEIQVEDGMVVARTTEPFTARSGLIALVGFEKGMFRPALQESGTFEEVRERAFEGSAYAGPEGGEPLEDRAVDFLFDNFWAIFGGIAAISACFSGRKLVKRRRRKKELLGGGINDVPWCRDVPVGGDLRRANGILNAIEGGSDYKKLISAYIVRLFYRKAFEPVRTEDGKWAVKVLPFKADPAEATSTDTDLEFDLYGFFQAAAGRNGLLENKELKRWARGHGESVSNWYKKMDSALSIWNIRKEDVQQVFGLRKFLKDFTLIGDRGVVEVRLWNNYLVFASLYGIAGQVRKDFKKVCPEYFSLSEVARMMDRMDDTTFRTMVDVPATYFYNSAHAYSAVQGASSWSGGGGGRSSWGGGGGFSGGGSGGGGR